MIALKRLYCCLMICMLSVCLLAPSSALAVKGYQSSKNEIPVTCVKVDGDSEHVYKVKLEPLNGAPAPENDVITVTQDSTDCFVVNVTEPGLFQYKMYEIADPADDKIDYDDTVYTVTIYTVIEYPDDPDSDTLLSKVVVDMGNEEYTKPTAFSFADTLIAGASTSETTETTASTTNSTESTKSTESSTSTDTTASTASTTDPNSSIPPQDPDKTSVQGVKSKPSSNTNSGKEKNSTPATITGDDLPIGLVVGIIAGAALVIVLILIFGKRSDKK